QEHQQSLTALFIRIVIVAMMYWMQANLAISVSITAHILPNDKTILMELGTFGTGQNVIYASLTAFPKSILSRI
ncbi:hypothetical protein BB019_08455, partial [Neisseria gonorrhoeae]